MAVVETVVTGRNGSVATSSRGKSGIRIAEVLALIDEEEAVLY